MSHSLSELLTLRNRIPSMTADEMRPLLLSLVNDRMDSDHLLSRAKVTASAVDHVKTLRDELTSAKTWDGRPDIVSRAYGQEIDLALKGKRHADR